MNRAVSFFMFVGLGFGSFSAEKLSSGLIAKGTEWEIPYYQRDSGIEGPIVFITGGVHGNEPAGARAAEPTRCGGRRASHRFLYQLHAAAVCMSHADDLMIMIEADQSGSCMHGYYIF